jgi:hypothetical protein
MQRYDPRLNEIKILEHADAIKTTKNYAGLGKFTSDKDAMQFRQSLAPKIFILFFGCIMTTPFLLEITKIFIKAPTGAQIASVVVGTFFGLLLLVIGIHRFSAEKATRIRIDKSGITLDGELYRWEDIYETAILQKYRSSYLTVILKEKATYRLYALTGFRVFDVFFPITLSKYIEHFKTMASFRP